MIQKVSQSFAFASNAKRFANANVVFFDAGFERTAKS